MKAQDTSDTSAPLSLLPAETLSLVTLPSPRMRMQTLGEKGQTQAEPDSHTSAPVVKSSTWELLRGLHKCHRNFCISVTLLPLPMPAGRDCLPGESWKSDIASLSLSSTEWTAVDS